MRKVIYLDSSFLVALLVENHDFYERALNISSRIGLKHLAISSLVLDEVLHSLGKYVNNKDVIFDIVSNFIRNTKNLSIKNSNLNIESCLLYMKIWRISSLRTRDALHLFLMQENNIDSIVTFDSDFLKISNDFNIEVIN